MTAHLDSQTWYAFLEGHLDADARRALAAHLEGGCEDCEAFLADAAARGEIDALDGPVDDALMSLAPAEPVHDDLGFERIRRSVRGSRRVTRVVAGLAGAVALAAALVLLIQPAAGPAGPGAERLKGPATAPQTRLQVFRAGHAGAAPVPLAPGATVPAGSTLLFRVHLDAPGCVQLWRRDHGPRALLPHRVCLDAGDHVLQAGGRALGLPLTAPGKVELWVVPEAKGTSPAAVQRSLSHGQALPGADHFGLNVAPAEAPEVP